MKLFAVVVLCFVPALTLVAQNNQQYIPLTPEHWTADTGRAEFIRHRGVPALKVSASPDGVFIKEGQVVLNDVQLDNGTIEFDVELADFFLSTIYFRRQNAENAEVFYIRTYRSGDPTGPDAVQYTTVTNGVALWDVHPEYQSAAVIHKEGWNHVKLVVSGRRMRVYVNDMSDPVMTIPELIGEGLGGSIAFEGGGIFANLVIKPGVTEGLDHEAAYDPIRDDTRYIHRWEASEPFDLPPGHELVSAMQFRAHSNHLPTDSTAWYSITSERSGLINLSRKFGKTEGRRALWLKKTIHSTVEQVREIDLGFSDEVWVLLNGKLVYVGKNLYSHPIMKDPFGQISVEDATFSLPLQEGDNELLVGVANSFFGWAVMARLSNMDGITFK